MKLTAKTTAILLGCCLSVLTTADAASAQTAFGLKAGINFSTADVEPETSNIEYGYQKGWLGGLFVIVKPESTIGAQVELLYSQRGSAIKVGTSGNLDGAYKLSFIDVPVLLRVRAAAFDRATLFVLAGPTIGVRVGADAEQSGSRTDIADRFESYDLGLTLATAFESDGFVIDGRYTHGVSNYANGSHPAVESLKSKTFTLSFGFRF